MTMMSNNNGNNGNNGQNLGDTTLTKVFVGGLAWETPKEAMRDHFEKFGEILEAVIISDKLTGRSKGYGFVTFKDVEAAKKACEDPAPIINGRRANCNLAALGARRPRSSSTTSAAAPPPQKGVSVGQRAAASTPPPNHHNVQWYYPTGTPATAATVAAPFPHHHHQVVPVYGYSPTYIPDMNYNHKVGFTGGSYMNGGHFSQMYLGQPMVGANTLMPMYPFYHFHQSQTMGLPAHLYSPTGAGPIPTVPALISKPTSIAPPNAGAAMGQQI